MKIGRLAVKIAGRDSGKKCLIISKVENGQVLVDGQTRRKKVNLIHLEPLEKVLKIDENASHDKVVKAFKDLKIEIKETKPKEKKERPKKVKKKSAKK